MFFFSPIKVRNHLITLLKKQVEILTKIINLSENSQFFSLHQFVDDCLQSINDFNQNFSLTYTDIQFVFDQVLDVYNKVNFFYFL